MDNRLQYLWPAWRWNEYITKNSIKVFSSGVVDISAGHHYNLVLKNDGSVWAMGNNLFGQLGNGNNNHQKTPIKIFNKDVTKIAAEHYSSFAVKADGSLWAMGLNSNGQLGDGTTSNRNLPAKFYKWSPSNYSECKHTLVIKNDGSLWAMGYNSMDNLVMERP